MAKEIHVVMLPWSAFGHMIPFFHLSLALAWRGIRVSFVSTPRNIQRLPKVPAQLENIFSFIELPLPTLDGDRQLPEGAEATVDLPEEKVEHLKAAYDLLKQPFRELIMELSPDWMIVDMMPHWASEVAKEKQVNLIFYGVLSACSSVFLGTTGWDRGESQVRISPRLTLEDWTHPPDWVDFPSTVAYRKHEASLFLAGAGTGANASGISDFERVCNLITSCHALVVRSCPEYDGDYLKLLGKMVGKPVLPVGLLIPDKGIAGGSIPDGSSWEASGIFRWLDVQAPNSVVYVGFGSEFKLSKRHVYEIALGLELSGLPFLWALRRPQWACNEVEALPPGFRERTSGIGRVCLGWVPQLEILSHPCIGGTLFHSGWGSIIESLQYGHVLVLLPFIIDQPLNARLLVEKGLGVEVDRSEDGSFSRADVAKALKLAMVDEEGEEIRRRAREAVGIFGNSNLQEGYVRKFVEFLKTETQI